MASIFIPLDEASSLEGIEYETLKKRLQRNPGKYITKTELPDCGGKSRVLVDVNSLSVKAQKAYQSKISIDIKGILDCKDTVDDEAYWYIDVDLHWYIENYKQYYYSNVELAKRIEEYLEYTGPNKTEYTNTYASRLGMSSRNYRRKVERYLEGMAWAIEMNEQTDKNYDYYKVLALCPVPRKRSTFISLTDEMKACIENIWYDKMFATNQRKQTKLYAIFKKVAESKGWIDIPSYPTVNRYINHLMETEANAHYLVAHGTKEWKRNKMVKGRRDTGALRVMELVQGDAHTFDCWVKLARDNGKITAIKPCLMAWVDTRSRIIPGYAICEIPSSQVIKQSLINMIYTTKNNEFEGVPRYLLIDNGKDYTAQSLTGRSRTVRVSLDCETKGFYRSIGIEDDLRSLPYQPWSKAQIERFFGTVCDDFTSSFDSYVGTLTGSKTIGKIKKNIKKMLEQDELYTIEEFAEIFDKWLNEEYMVRVHKGLKEQNEKIPTPLGVYRSAERYYKAAPPLEFAQMMLMKCEDVYVYVTGINKFGTSYYADELAPYIGQHVDIRYNPSDLTYIIAYNKDGARICELERCTPLPAVASRNDEEITDHIRRQKRQLRDAREIALYRQTPYEERIHQERSERKVITSELSQETPKVISIPDDKQYRNEVKRKRAKEEKNEFMQKQAEKALAKIKNFDKAEGI